MSVLFVALYSFDNLFVLVEYMKKSFFSITVLLALCGALSAYSNTPVYLDTNAPVEARVEDAISRMTLQEKINMVHAQSKFSSPGVPRLGIPEVWCTDGPHGVRPDVLWDQWDQAGQTNDSIVAFPALTCLAATWNPEMSYLYGKSIGEEARFRKKTVLLGPGVNINRTPLNGRNFEYMGEDPYLASKMVVPYIKGVQQNGVATCVKHFCVNNHEWNRYTTNSIVDDRALYEIYLPAFKAAVVEGGTWSIMPGYNLYNGHHLTDNKRILMDILKGEWGFDGVAISDWGAVYDTDGAVKNGLDLEYGTWTNGLNDQTRSNAYDYYFLAKPYLEKIQKGELGTEELDDKVRRILRLIMRTEMSANRPFGSICSDEHYAAARRIAGEGIVLLQNRNNILPLPTDKGGKILVVGENAIKMMTIGGGSSSLKAQREVLPLEGIVSALEGSDVVVEYQRGYVGDPTGEYNKVVARNDLSESRTAEQLIEDAVDAAREADYVIFFGGLNKSDFQDCEGVDRKQLALPYEQDKVVEAIAAVNQNIVFVNISGNAVEMPWIDKVPGIIQGWYIGSEAGNALADVIFGKVNPSGKLPMTFPMSLDKVGAHAYGPTGYPGVLNRENSNQIDMTYNEGILVGYRWNDTKKIKPLFPFGYGLSYTTFEYGKLTADRKTMTVDEQITVSIPITNTGNREGAEVVQLYISDSKCSVLRPVKELKSFAKVSLSPGETRVVSFTISVDDLKFFDDAKHEWIAEPGEFVVHAAASSADIKSSYKFQLK